MLLSDFRFDLPEHLIAQAPPHQRGDSRLLSLDRHGALDDGRFADLAARLRPGDLLVFNDTRVIPARLFGAKASGGKVEVLVERVLGGHEAVAHVRASKSPKPGTRLDMEGGYSIEVTGRDGDLFRLRFAADDSVWSLLERHGHMPLPPYIRRADSGEDRSRYQTVYARVPGAVAAPTAGLHFTPALLDELAAMGVERAFVTLHVGAGTFQPVRTERVSEHRMHGEWLSVGADTVARIEATRAAGGRVVAVGTTVVRALESAARSGRLEVFEGDTDIFITPGYRFRVIDALVTNFHLPESTLLMLVCAFAGQAPVLAAYRHAVEQAYRFFSYGDAMFIEAPASAR